MRKHQKRLLEFEWIGEIIAPDSDGLSELERQEQQEDGRVVLAELEAKLSSLSCRIFRMRFSKESRFRKSLPRLVVPRIASR